MKKLRILIQYECMTSFKYIWLFYAIEYAIVLLIYVIVAILTGDPKNAGTNCLEMNTFIYVGILGALGYSEDFKMMIQNGFTRKYIFTASFVMFAFIGGIMSLVDTVTGNLLHYFLPNYSSLFGVIYGYGDILPNWLWLFLLYMLTCSLFYLAEHRTDVFGGGYMPASGYVYQLAWREPAFQGFIQRDGVCRKSVVVGPLHHRVVGVGSYEGYRHVLVQRQQPVAVL